MDAAAATLLMAAQRLQHGGALDRANYGRIVSQLREVTDQLTALEKRSGNQEARPVNYTAMLRDTAAMTSPLSEEIMVEGPAHDLHDLLCVLAEYALTAGHNPIDVRLEVNRKKNEAKEMCVTELVVHSSDIPDFLRRKLWEAVRIRRGEVSVIAEPERCRIEFKLPIERRRAAAA
jgi:hypothetical protein